MKIYLYDLWKNCYTNEFEDEEDLINFLVSNTRKSCWWNSKNGYARNEYLDNINVTGNDTFHYYYEWDKSEVRLRPYMFVKEDDSILDARIYWEEVKRRWDIKQEEYHKQTHVAEDAQQGDKYTRYRWQHKGEGIFYFRASPVPGTSSRIRYGRYLRSPHTFNEMKLNTDPEYKQYTRPARRNLPTVWDDIPRGYYKGWKHCTKKRKQWM